MKACLLTVLIAAVSVGMSAASEDNSLVAPAQKAGIAVPPHREWVNVPVGSTGILAFVVHPVRSDKAPVVVITQKDHGATKWIRAVSEEIAADGFIAVVPEVLTGLGPNGGDSDSFASPAAAENALANLGREEIERRIEAVRLYALALPAATGQSARLEVDRTAGHIAATIDSATGSRTAGFNLSAKGWRKAMTYLAEQTRTSLVSTQIPQQTERAVLMAMAQQTGRAGQLAPFALAEKRPDLPAHYYTAKSALANSKLRKEWVDIPVGDVKLHMWVEYPEGNGKAGVMIVMQHGTGLDDWMRAVADQLAHEGFIAVAPDIWSGTGPNGGGRDSFQFEDDAMKAAARIGADETQRRYKAARDWAMKLPRANGKSGSLGFCAGGGNSFRFAGEVPELNAAVVFYGTPPSEEIMAKINAPVLGFYGENDARVTSTVEPTIAAMKRLGKTFEPHIYPRTTHSFVLFQDIAANQEALKDAWPRAIAFLKQNLT